MMSTPAPAIPSAALPPPGQLSGDILALATAVAQAVGQPEADEYITWALRLGSAYGEYAGLGLIAPGHALTWTCEVMSAFESRADGSGSSGLLGAVSQVLQSEALQQQFPDLAKRPRPNENFLFDLHWQLSAASAYDLLAPDLQLGAIAALHRTRWRRTRAIRKSLDAMATAALRLIPRLDRESLQRALSASGDPSAITAVFREAAFQLEYERAPGKALPRSTQIGYLRVMSSNPELYTFDHRAVRVRLTRCSAFQRTRRGKVLRLHSMKIASMWQGPKLREMTASGWSGTGSKSSIASDRNPKPPAAYKLMCKPP